MREINDYVSLSTDVDPQEEDAEKSPDFDDISELRFYFFTVMSYNPHACTINSGVCDLIKMISLSHSRSHCLGEIRPYRMWLNTWKHLLSIVPYCDSGRR